MTQGPALLPSFLPGKTPNRTRRRLLLASGAAATAASLGVRADDFPNRPVRLLVPYPAGGATDFIARTLGADLSGRLGQQWVIENRPGATTIVAAELLARSHADGYTLMLADTATLATNRSLYAKLSYDPLRDFTPIARVARIPLCLVTSVESPWTSTESLMAALKSRPGGFNVGSSGLGSPHHLAAELFLRQTGLRAQHVPYKGAAPMLQDLVGHRIDFAFLDLPTMRGALAGGRLRLLAAATRKRLKALPDLASLDEQGLHGFDAFAWQGIVAPAKLPAERVSTLYRAIDASLDASALEQRLAEGGVEVFPAAPGQFSAFIASETQRWAKVIADAGIRLE